MSLRKRLAESDALLHWQARRWAGHVLATDERLLASEVGNLVRFREGRRSVPVRDPVWWTSFLPVTRALTNVTFSERQILFLSNSLRLNAPLALVYRVDADAGEMTFSFGRHNEHFSALAVRIRGRGAARRAATFASRVLASRDQSVIHLPASQARVVRSYQQQLSVVNLASLWAERQPVTGGAVDENVLNRVLAVAKAAYDGDPTEFTAARNVLRWVTSPQEGDVVADYAVVLLRFRVLRLIGHRPSTVELEELAAQRRAQFHAVFVDAREDLLDDILFDLFGSPLRGSFEPGALIFGLMAALGVFVDHFERDLEEPRALLARTLRDRHAKLAENSAAIDSE